MKIRCLLPILACAIPLVHGQIIYQAFLDGLSESPSVPTPGIGTARVSYDAAAHTLAFDVSFSGLLGSTTVAHIHAPTASPGAGTVGVAVAPTTLPGFPVGVTSGSYLHTLDLADTASYTATFLTGAGGTAAAAESALATSLGGGTAYFNVHTSFAPGGEIRGFFAPVPEPATTALIGAGLLGSFALYRRRPGGRGARVFSAT